MSLKGKTVKELLSILEGLMKGEHHAIQETLDDLEQAEITQEEIQEGAKGLREKAERALRVVWVLSEGAVRGESKDLEEAGIALMNLSEKDLSKLERLLPPTEGQPIISRKGWDDPIY